MENESRKRIGVIMPAIIETLDALYLDGICHQVCTQGYDVIVFTCSSNMRSESAQNAYTLGEESIYRLVPKVRLDGLIFAGGKFHDPATAHRILNKLNGISCPCVCTDFENEIFPSVRISQVDSIQKVTEHLIFDHGFKEIFCLTGPQGNPDAEERLAGWRIAMERAGLPISQYCYGDFWREKATKLADDFALGHAPMPEAVVCTNDIMAISLCKQLSRYGIRVPEDIAVTGFDGGQNAILTTPTLTTVDGKEFELGSNAGLALLNLLDGQKRPYIQAQSILFGKSCGCHQERRTGKYLEKFYEKFLLTSEYCEIRMMSDYINKMASAESLAQLSTRIDELADVIPYWNDLYVCIQPLFDQMKETNDALSLTDFTEKMWLFVSKHRYRSSDNAMKFDTVNFLPPDVIDQNPLLMIATPLHNADMSFGYIVTSYSDPKQYAFDDLYVSWRDSISNALSVQYIKAQNRFLNQRLEMFSERDSMTGMLNLKGLSKNMIFKQKYAFIVLELKWIQTLSNQISITPDLFLANVLRMNCTESEICFRYNKNVFGVLIPLPEKMDVERCCEEWTMRFDAFIDLVNQREKKLEKPIIRFYYDQLETDTIPEQEALEIRIQTQLHHDISPSVVKGNYVQQLEELRRRIIRKPSEEWIQETIAGTMGISESYFRRIYKQHFRVSFHADLIHIRMSHAMKLLKQTDMNIKVIAEQCGYANIYHFMTAFKKETGLTTTEFRNVKRGSK